MTFSQTLFKLINFAEVPSLVGFPSKGILQFYLSSIGINTDSNTGVYGADLDDRTCQNGFRVIYHAETEMNESKLMSDFSFMPSPWQEDNVWMPFSFASNHLEKTNSCLSLTFQRRTMPISPNDYLCEALSGFDLYGLEDENDLEMDSYYEMFYGHRLGGYPAFTQEDPQSYATKNKEPYILVLQIDSENNDKVDIM